MTAGWENCHNSKNEKTACFAEVGSLGLGADMSGRVAWSEKVCACRTNYDTLKEVLQGCDKWNQEKDLDK